MKIILTILVLSFVPSYGTIPICVQKMGVFTSNGERIKKIEYSQEIRETLQSLTAHAFDFGEKRKHKFAIGSFQGNFAVGFQNDSRSVLVQGLLVPANFDDVFDIFSQIGLWQKIPPQVNTNGQYFLVDSEFNMPRFESYQRKISPGLFERFRSLFLEGNFFPPAEVQTVYRRPKIVLFETHPENTNENSYIHFIYLSTDEELAEGEMISFQVFETLGP